MRVMSRREWNGLVVGGLIARPLAGALTAQASSSAIAGVRIGAQSYSFRDRSLDATIAAMSEIGLAGCELWQGHIETREAIGAPEGVAPRDALRAWRLAVPLSVFTGIREKFDRAKIPLTAYNLSFRDDFSDEEIDRGFEMAKALGVSVITASSNVTTAAKVDPFAKKHGITVGFHNHADEKPNEFAGPEDFDEAMRGTSDRIAINLDIGHFVAAGHDPVAFLDKHHSRIVSVHLKDRKKGDTSSNLPFGQGDTPIVAVLQRLRDRHWDIPANIEYEYKGADTVAEVRRCFDYCKQALKETSK